MPNRIREYNGPQNRINLTMSYLRFQELSANNLDRVTRELESLSESLKLVSISSTGKLVDRSSTVDDLGKHPALTLEKWFSEYDLQVAEASRLLIVMRSCIKELETSLGE